MRINNNIMALNTHRQLSINNTNTQKSLEKLSSGYRINRAGDDAAGLAISEKMRAQIRGLTMASKNAQDGISLIQTAEGALTEVHEILQRMRELAVQSANDTNVEVDRSEIQKEIDQLASEITRIANNTEFNTQKLLNGGIEDIKFHIGANHGQDIKLSISAMDAKKLGVTRDVLQGTVDPTNAAKVAEVKVDSVDVTKTLDAGNYTVKVENVAAGTNVEAAEGASVTGYDSAVTGKATINTNITLTYSAAKNGSGTQTGATIADTNVTNGATAMGTIARTGDIAANVAGDYKLVFTSATNYIILKDDGTGNFADTGKTGTVGDVNTQISGISFTVAAAVGGAYQSGDTMTFTINADTAEAWTASGDLTGVVSGDTNPINGLNIDITKLTGATDGDVVTISAFAEDSTTVQLFDENGESPIGDAVNIDIEKGGEYTIGDTTTGQMKVRFDAGQATAGTTTVTVSSQESTTATKQPDGTMSDAVAYGGINVSSQTAASDAITEINKAIEAVSTERSKLGAMQNRLEHTIKNLDTSAENLQAAESRIRDVDMAKEMMEITKQNILQQAATAMLAQANMAPQTVLKLLG